MDRSKIAEGVGQAMQLKSKSFFSDNVRHLYINPQSRWSPEKISELLRLCPQLVSLFVIGHLLQPTLLPILDGMAQAQRWGGCLGNLFGISSAIDLSHPFFRTVTHIDIFEAVDDENGAQICPGLAALPALTHLCLNNDVPVDIFKRLLEQCPRLQIMLHLWHEVYSESARDVANDPRVADVRYVVAVFTDYWSDWEGWARGGTDVWAAADTFVARKRQDEIEGTLLIYFCFSSAR
jgi:hypothetical protein